MAKELRVVIAGDSSALQAALARASGATQGFGASVSRIGSRIASTGASLTRGLTLPIVGLGALSAKSAIDFQSAMELLHTQAGVAQGAIAGLSKSVLGLAGPTATAPSTLAAGLYHLESQGLRGAKALDTLRIAAEGAKMGQANLEDVTNALGAVISSKISGVHSYEQAMGQLNATVGAGDMRMQDLADAFGTGLAAKAAVAHVALNDVNAALATLGDNNIRGAEAGTLLNSTFRVMEGPSHAAAKRMAEMGVSSEHLGQLLSGPSGLVGAISYLQEKLAGLSHAQKFAALTQMFGSKQAGGVLILVDQLQRLKQKEEEVRRGGEAFGKDWSAYTQTAAYHLDSMGAAMQASGITIGNILLPLVSKATNYIAGLVQKFDELSPSTKKFIVIAAGIAAALGPALSIVGNGIKLIGGLSQAVMFLAANPIVLAIAALALFAGAVAAAVIWPKQFTSVLEKLGLSAQQAAGVIRFLQTVFQDVKVVFHDVVTVCEALWARFGDVIMGEARTAWNMVKGVISGALNVIRGLVNVFAGLYHGDWARVWQGIKQVFSGAWQVIWSLVKGGLETVANVFRVEGRIWLAVVEAVWHAISASASSAWGGISSAVGKAVGKVEDVVKHGFDAVLAFIKSLPGEFLALGEAAGAALLQGVAKGIEGAIGSVLSVASKAKNAVKSVWHAAFGSTPDEWGSYAVGAPLMQGIAAGIAAQQGTVTSAAGKAKAALKSSLETRDIYALVVQYGHELGLKQAEGVVGGILTGTPSIVNQVRTALQQAVQKARQDVVDSRAGFTSAFGNLATQALSAFDAKVQAWVPPAQALLDNMQLQDQVKAAADAVSQAQDQLTQAQNALAASTDPDAQALANLAQKATDAQITLDNLKASGTASKQAIADSQSAYDQAASAVKAFTLSHPGVSTNTDTASLVAQVTQAQQQLASAVRSQKELELQMEAAEEQKKYDRLMAIQREAMAKQLVELQKALLKHPAAWRTAAARVEAVLKEHGVRMVPSGQAWASMFADGIRQGIPKVKAAAHAMAAAVDRYMPHSPAKAGPLSYDAARSGKAWAERFHEGFANSFPDINGQTSAYMGGLGGGASRTSAAGPLVHVAHMEVRDEVDVRLVARELATKLGV